MQVSEHELQRQREREERAWSDVQRARMRELHAQGKEAYPDKRSGARIVAEFRQYCETMSADSIGAGLYSLLIGGAGGFNEIAHYDIHGFRHVYRHPALLIEDVIVPEVSRWPQARRIDPNGYHSFYVYKDGMTSGEAAYAIVVIAADRKEAVYADYARTVHADELAQAAMLAEKLGMALVPR